MIAVRFQIGIFDLNKKTLLEVNKGFAARVDDRLALVNDAEIGKLDPDEFHIWNSVDEVVDLYVQSAHEGGGFIVENTKLENGTNMIKVNVERTGRRFNLMLEAQK